jgi:O-antigen/teichoic acid export membrane protein
MEMTTAEVENCGTTGPMAIPSLRSNFAWTFAGNMLYAGCQWGMLSALAKLGSTSIVGQFTLGLAISAPVFMFTNLQLRAVQATDVNAESGFADYYTLRLLATLLGLAMVALTLPFIGGVPGVKAVVFLVAIAKSVECMSDVSAGLLQREEQLKRVAISLIIRGIASVAVFSSVFAYSRNLQVAIMGMIGVWGAVLLLYDLPNVRRFGRFHESFFRYDRSALSRLALLGLPLGVVATLSSLITNIPRYFLQHNLGLAEQGIFASLAYLVVVINLVVNALCQSVTTRLSRLFADGDFRQFKVLLTKLCMFGVLIIVAGVPLTFVIGRPLVTLLYRREYADHIGMLALLVAVMGVQTIASFLVGGLTAAREFKVQFPVHSLAVLMAVAGSAFLVPRYGLMGAGSALFLSMMTLATGCFWALSEILRNRRSLANVEPH